MFRTKASIAVGLAAGAVALALAGCSGGGPTPTSAGTDRVDSPGVTSETVSIGVISDQTGPTAGIMLPWLHGLQAAIGAVNESGGINGRAVKVLAEDDKYDVAIGQPAFKKLVDQTPVVAILGLNASNTQSAILPLIDESGVPVLSGQTTMLCSVDPVTKYFFGLAPTYQDQVNAMLAWALQRVGQDELRVAVIHNGTASGAEVYDLIEKLVPTGSEVVGEVVVAPGVTTLDAEWQQVVSLEPDVVLFHGTSSAVNLIAATQEKFGTELPVIGVAPSGGPSAFAGATPKYGNLFDYVQWASPVPIETEGTAAMVAASKAAGYGGEVNNPDYVTGYIAGLVISEAIRLAGEADPNRDAVRDALASMGDFSTQGLSPNVSFSETDRIGVQDLRPVRWVYGEDVVEAVGDFGDFTLN